jgi:SAM-dependent methyltransferase
MPAYSPEKQYDLIADLYDGYPGDYLEDVLFYVEEGKKSRTPVLEIGVGTGRLALCLAAVGVEVVGIDSSPAMLHRLADKRATLPEIAPRVQVIAADMRDFALRQRFEVALLPFRTFLYLLTPEDQQQSLRTIRQHLEPGGSLVMSFFVPPRGLLRQGRTPRQEMSRFPSPDGDGEVVAFDWAEFVRPRRQVVSHITYEWRDGDGRATRQLDHSMVARYVFPEEVPPLLESCGYRVVASYGSFGRAPLTAKSREQIWVAQPVQRK